MHDVLGSPGWGSNAEVLQSALGIRMAVVDLATARTLYGGEPVAACDPGRVPGVGCLVRAERELDPADPAPLRAVCDAGLAFHLHPVIVEGGVACHVLVYGYVHQAKDRVRVLQRVMAEGRDEDEARAAIEALPEIPSERVEAAAELVASQVEAALTARTDEVRRVGRQLEVSLLADVARELGPDGLVLDRIPAGSLASVVRLTGAECGRIALLHGRSRVPQSVAEVGECGSLPAVADDDLVRHVLSTGRSAVVSGTDDRGRKTSLIAVPLGRKARPGGVLSLVKAGPGGMAADDVRVVELFAEIVSAMLDNANDFVAANTRLVEMIQVSEVARAFNSTLDFGRLVELAVQVLGKALDFDVAGLVVDSFGAVHGRVVHTVEASEADIREVLAEAAGLTGEALPVGVTVVSQFARMTEAEGPTAEWTVLSRELRVRNIRAGSLFVASSASGAFRDGDERVLGALADHLSVALENAMLYSRLEIDFGRAMAALTAMADATERLESGHTDRVMDYAVAIGRAMGLSFERLGLLRFAGLLHDLGKLGVAEEILIKPTALTPEEMERVRQHSEVGASIVEQVRTLEEITPIVRHHHEHWDGSGYPDRLAGEDIPLEARMLAVADAYEAMTGVRTHRKRMAPATARAELQRAAGTQFDPAVVEAFIGVLDARAFGAATGAYGVVMDGPQLPA